MLERWIILNLFEFYANDLGGGKMTTHFKLLCVQRYGRGTSEGAYLGGGTVESAHKGAPGCCQWGTWKSCSAGSVTLCTKACAGSEPPQPPAAGNARAYAQASNVLATLGQKSNPSGAFPETPATRALRLLQIAPRVGSQLPSASGERIKPATLQDSQRISESEQ